jgi:hypothetical protein
MLVSDRPKAKFAGCRRWGVVCAPHRAKHPVSSSITAEQFTVLVIPILLNTASYRENQTGWKMLHAVLLKNALRSGLKNAHGAIT